MNVTFQELLGEIELASRIRPAISYVYILNLHTGKYKVDDASEQGNMTAINHFLRAWVQSANDTAGELHDPKCMHASLATHMAVKSMILQSTLKLFPCLTFPSLLECSPISFS